MLQNTNCQLMSSVYRHVVQSAAAGRFFTLHMIPKKVIDLTITALHGWARKEKAERQSFTIHQVAWPYIDVLIRTEQKCGYHS